MTATIYITFGVQYGHGPGKIPHPVADWITGEGYLRVDYNPDASTVPEQDSYGEPLAKPRERALRAVWAWLGGRYAFDYNEPPSLEHAPAGEIGRLILP
jgi:hypothetical protein